MPGGSPAVYSAYPSSGPTTGGIAVVLYGYNFQPSGGVWDVRVDGSSVGFTVDSDEQITITSMPAHAAGYVDIEAEDDMGVGTLYSGFEYTDGAAPTITSISDNYGDPAGGTWTSITGTGFLAGITAIHFGATLAASVIPGTDTGCTAQSPAGTGSVHITVTTSNGTSSTSSADLFTYKATVAITRAVKWTVANTRSVTRAAKWSVAAKVSQTRAVKWVVANTRSVTRQAKWSVAALVNKTRQVKWGVNGVVSLTRATKWSVAALVNKTRQVKWGVNGVVSIARAAKWSVASLVNKTRQAKWSVAGLVSQTRVVKWSVNGIVSLARQAKWTVANPVAATRAVKWAVAARVNQTRAVKWSVASLVSQTRAAKWSVNSLASVTRAAKWTVASLANLTRQVKWSVLGPATPDTPRPTPSPWLFTLTIGGEDVTPYCDLSTLEGSPLRTEHGPGSLTVDIPLGDQWERVSNAIVQRSPVILCCNGEPIFWGKVLNVQPTGPLAPKMTVTCAGPWNDLGRDGSYYQSWVATDYSQWQSLSKDVLDLNDPFWVIDYVNYISLDGDFTLTVPKGTATRPNQGQAWGFVIDRGLPGSVITNMLVHVNTYPQVPSGWTWVLSSAVYDPTATKLWTILEGGDLDNYESHEDADHTYTLLDGANAVVLTVQTAADITPMTSEAYLQFSNLKFLVDRAAAPTVDQVIAEICTAPGLATTADAPDFGSALGSFVIDPFTTRADAVEVASQRADVKVLAGFRESATEIKVRAKPAAPDGTTRRTTLSSQLSPGADWSVSANDEQRPNYVRLAYTLLSTLPGMTDTLMYYDYPLHVAPLAADEKVLLFDKTGDSMTTAEAGLAAQQIWTRAQDTMTGDAGPLVGDVFADGAWVPAAFLREWDWCRWGDDPEGPWLIVSEVHLSGADGGAVSLTLGEQTDLTSNSPHREKTDYIGGHNLRELYSVWWKRNHHGKAMPKKHPKYHNTWIEGKYS